MENKSVLSLIVSAIVVIIQVLFVELCWDATHLFLALEVISSIVLSIYSLLLAKKGIEQEKSFLAYIAMLVGIVINFLAVIQVLAVISTIIFTKGV